MDKSETLFWIELILIFFNSLQTYILGLLLARFELIQDQEVGYNRAKDLERNYQALPIMKKLRSNHEATTYFHLGIPPELSGFVCIPYML